MKVWIVSRDAGFAEEWLKSWQRWSRTTATVIDVAENCGELPEEASVVVVDGAKALAALQEATPRDATRREDVALAIAVVADEDLACGETQRRVVRIGRREGWAELAAALAEQAVLRLQAVERQAGAERELREATRFAAIGRFITERRHELGNALTGVLGNAELVLQESGEQLQQEVREQLETIHTMSLRIFEILQRLSSLEMEMRMAEKQAAQDARAGSAKGD